MTCTKTYDKAIIKFWFHPRVYNIHSLQSALSTHCTVLKTDGNWRTRKHSEQVNWSSFWQMHSFIGFRFYFYALFTVFSVFWNFWHRKSCFLWHFFFCLFPKFHGFFLFSVSQKTGNVTIGRIQCEAQNLTFLNMWFNFHEFCKSDIAKYFHFNLYLFRGMKTSEKSRK